MGTVGRALSIRSMPGREEWNEIAAGDADELRERILTGYKSGKPFTPYVPTIPLPDPIELGARLRLRASGVTSPF